jgi:hypothetical protein
LISTGAVGNLFFIAPNVLHKTSKGMRDMNYQDTQQFERATMLKLPIQPLLVLCGVSSSLLLIKIKTKRHENISCVRRVANSL